MFNSVLFLPVKGSVILRLFLLFFLLRSFWFFVRLFGFFGLCIIRLLLLFILAVGYTDKLFEQLLSTLVG